MKKVLCGFCLAEIIDGKHTTPICPKWPSVPLQFVQPPRLSWWARVWARVLEWLRG
jgi:hypothetical protein